ncbi:MAG: protein kinase [Planctomycetia bacterium]|nr:protein kinase [Planctomycetia bacterium]
MAKEVSQSGQTFNGAVTAGAKVGRYEVIEKIAAGGMAIVYKAYDRSLDRYVALKQISPSLARDEKFAERFRQEAKVLARLSTSQPNLVSVHELIEQDGQIFIAMEYVEGSTLRKVMDRQAIPMQRGVGILLAITLGLKAMHSNGVIQRDLTPSNIMLPPEGGAKISDFGLIGHSGGRTSMPMGTTKYMAPEMFTGGAIDARADIYSLGFIAYEMFCGAQAFAKVFHDVLEDSRAETMRWMHWHANTELGAPTLQEIGANIPSLLSKIIERMMDKDPARRFSSIDQVIKWLRRIFVMHIQKKSLTSADSEKLNREVEQEITGAAETRKAQVPVLPDRRPGGKRKKMAAEDEGADKTAPLPRRRLTKRQKITYAGIAGGVVVLALIGLLIYDSMTTGAMVREIERKLEEAKELYQDEEYAKSLALYEDIISSPKYESMAGSNLIAEASAYIYMPKAGMALKEQRWDDSLKLLYDAERKGVDATLIRQFENLYDFEHNVQTAIKAAEQEVLLGNYDRAIDILLEAARKYPTAKLADRIRPFQQKARDIKYQTLLKLGDAAFESGDISQAESYYKQAYSIKEEAEIIERLKKIGNFHKYDKLRREADIAAAEKNWDTAAEKYEDAYRLMPSASLKRKRDRAKAEVLAAAGDALEKVNQIPQAIEKWEAALALVRSLPGPASKLQVHKVEKELRALIRAGNSAVGSGDYAIAISRFKEALELAKTREQKKELEKKIDDAEFRQAVMLGDAAADKQNWDVAEQQFRKAQAMRPNDQSIDLRIKQLQDKKQYHEYLTQGKEALRQGMFDRAVKFFKEALAVMEKPVARTLIRESKYRQNITAGRKSMATRKYTVAIAYFRVAKDLKDTEEVRKLIRKAKEAMESDG